MLYKPSTLKLDVRRPSILSNPFTMNKDESQLFRQTGASGGAPGCSGVRGYQSVVRGCRTWLSGPETIAQGRTAEIETIIDERNERESEPAELDPIATLTLELRALGKLKELELFSKTAMTNKEIAARVVCNERAARKELKQLEKRMARERHAMRKKLTERKTSEQLTEPDEHKVPEQLTEPEIEHLHDCRCLRIRRVFRRYRR
jgi:hypothetical protein